MKKKIKLGDKDVKVGVSKSNSLIFIGLLRNFLESEKFPFLKCASGNRALENFQESKSFLF